MIKTLIWSGLVLCKDNLLKNTMDNIDLSLIFYYVKKEQVNYTV